MAGFFDDLIPEVPSGSRRPARMEPDYGAIDATASRLGVSPKDLETVIRYETAGTMNPAIVGGTNNRHLGLIQFGPEERRRYGAHAGQTFGEQMVAVEAYLKDRGLPQGADLSTIYRTINGGNPKASLSANDGNGTIAQHVARMGGTPGGGGGGNREPGFFDDLLTNAPAAPAAKPQKYVGLDDFIKQSNPKDDIERGDAAQRWIDTYGAMKPPSTKRTGGEVITDIAVAAASGVGSMLEGFGTLYGLASEDMNNGLRQLGQATTKYWDSLKSEGLVERERQRKEKIDAADSDVEKFTTAIWQTVKDPALLTTIVGQNIPMKIPGGAAGRVAGALGKVAGASAEGASMLSLGTAITSNAVLQGADVASNAYEDAIKLPQTLWDANPAYLELRGEVGDQKAKEAMARDMALQAGVYGALLSAGVNSIPGMQSVERMVTGTLRGSGAGMIRGALTGGLKEATTEALEEGGGKAFANQALQQIEPDRSLMKDVAENAGLGAAGGGPLGVLAGAAGGRARDALPPMPAPTPATPSAPPPSVNTIMSSSTVDEATREAERVVFEPLPGDVGRAVADGLNVDLTPTPGPMPLTVEQVQRKQQANQYRADLEARQSDGAERASLIGEEMADQRRRLEQEAAAQRLMADTKAASAQETINATLDRQRLEETAANRNAILEPLLQDESIANHAGAFAAALRREGFRDTTPTPVELDRIERFKAVRDASAEVVPMESGAAPLEAFIPEKQHPETQMAQQFRIAQEKLRARREAEAAVPVAPQVAPQQVEPPPALPATEPVAAAPLQPPTEAPATAQAAEKSETNPGLVSLSPAVGSDGAPTPKLNMFGLPVGTKFGPNEKVTVADLNAGDWLMVDGKPMRVLSAEPAINGKRRVALDHQFGVTENDHAVEAKVTRKTIVAPPQSPQNSDATAATPTVEPALNTPAAQPESAPDTRVDSIRTFVESLIKRRSAASELGKSRTFNTALEKAKEALSVSDVRPQVFDVYAKALAGDEVTATALKGIAETLRTPRAPQDSPAAPKTVAGTPAASMETPELQRMASDPAVPANTRHAAAAAVQARIEQPIAPPARAETVAPAPRQSEASAAPPVASAGEARPDPIFSQSEYDKARYVANESGRTTFPIMGSSGSFAIPYSLLAGSEAQAQKNHFQTLAGLARRGGLTAHEALAVIKGVHYSKIPGRDFDHVVELQKLAGIIKPKIEAKAASAPAVPEETQPVINTPVSIRPDNRDAYSGAPESGSAVSATPSVNSDLAAPAAPAAPVVKIGGRPVVDIELPRLRTFAARGGPAVRERAAAEITRREEARRIDREARQATEILKDTPSRDVFRIINAYGGINAKAALDVAGDRGVRGLGHWARVFKEQRRDSTGTIVAGHGMDEIALELQRQGYMTQEDYDADGSNIASQIVRDAIFGQLGPTTEEQIQKARERDLQAQQDREEAETALRAEGAEVTPDNIQSAMTVAEALAIIPKSDYAMLDEKADTMTNDAWESFVIKYAEGIQNERDGRLQEGNQSGEEAGREEARTPEQAGAEGEVAPLELAAQSPEDLNAANEQARADEARAKAESATRAAAEKAETDRKAIAEASAKAADDFSLTSTAPVDKATHKAVDAKSATDQLAGQGDIFSQPANTLSLADTLRLAAAKMDEQNAPKPATEAKPAEEARKPRVTPQVASPSMLKTFIAIAADSIGQLRKVDVERVLTSNPIIYQASIANHIKENRPDLAQEVDDVLAEAAPPVDAKQDQANTDDVVRTGDDALSRAWQQLDESEQQAVESEVGREPFDVAVTAWLEGRKEQAETWLTTVSAKVKAAFRKAVAFMVSVAVAINISNVQDANAFPKSPSFTSKISVERMVERQQADFTGADHSPFASLTANWIMATGAHRGRSFIVADKEGGKLYAFDGKGKLVGDSPALYGEAMKDKLTDAQMSKSMEQVTAEDKITPSGHWNLQLEQHPEYGPALRFGGGNGLGIHAVYLGTPSENRSQKLATPTAADNYVTYGCINVPEEFAADTLAPHFASEAGHALFILPIQSEKTVSEFGMVAQDFEPEVITTEQDNLSTGEDATPSGTQRGDADRRMTRAQEARADSRRRETKDPDTGTAMFSDWNGWNSIDTSTGDEQNKPHAKVPRTPRTDADAEGVLTSLRAAISGHLGRDIPEGTFSVVQPAAYTSGMSDDVAARARDYAVASRIAASFGKEVVYVQINNPEIINFNGLSTGRAPSKLIVNVDGSQPAIFTTGHELFHKMQTERPDLFRRFADAVDGMIQDETSFEHKLADPENMRTELLADFAGWNMTRPEFWRELSKREPTFFERIANYVTSFLDGVMKSLGMRVRQSDRYFKDVAAARTALVDALADYRAGDTNTSNDLQFNGSQESKFSRSTGGGMKREEVNAVASIFRSKFKGLPPIHVMQSVKEAPESLRKDIQKVGGENDTGGAWYNGEIYLFADNLRDAEHAKWVTLHEATHNGLRGMFGRELDPVMMSIYMSNETIRDLAKEQKKQFPTLSTMAATEEALANMGADGVPQSVWDRLVAGIRRILRKAGFTLELSDNDIRNIVSRALAFNKTPSRTTDIVRGTAFMTAYHGSPHDFDQFSLDHIGSGEGAQAYGHGLYFAGRREVAEHYKSALTSRKLGTMDWSKVKLPPNLTPDEYTELNVLNKKIRDTAKPGPQPQLTESESAQWRSLMDKSRAFEDAVDAATPKGRLYQVDLAPQEDEYLLWDKPLSQQSEKVKEALRSVPDTRAVPDMFLKGYNLKTGTLGEIMDKAQDMVGAEIYRGIGQAMAQPVDEMADGPNPRGWNVINQTINDRMSDDEAASKYLSSIGIPGIKYLDGSSRNKATAAAWESDAVDKWVGVSSDGQEKRGFESKAAAMEWAEENSERLNHNYVIFDDKNVKVEAKFSRAPSGSLAATMDTLKSNAAANGRLKTVADLFENSSKFGFLSKTLQTQFHKASKDTHFKRVFDSVNDQITDTSRFALEAEAEAPSILQRMEGAGDVWRTWTQGNAKSQADLKAVSKAIFANIEGLTGVQQKVFTDAELAKDYGLTPKQTELYREFRAAVDTSLDRLAQTLMMKTAGTYVNTGSMKGLSLDETAAEVDGMLATRQDYAKDRLATIEDERRASDADRETSRTIDEFGNEQFRSMKPRTATEEGLQKEIDDIQDVRDRIAEMVKYTADLKDKGYSPAMRFGKYAVSVMDGDNTEFFAMYETNSEANIARMQLRREFPGSTITKHEMNQDQWQMFQGVSPETVELFAKFMGADEADAFKAYASLATSSRSTMKRMLERKGVAGFSLDTQRVLAQFVTSNARQSSINVHSREINDALFAIPKEKGDVQSEAQKLVDYVRNPKEEAAGLRGLLFMHFLGGSLASSMVNMTQPVLMTTPYLHQFAGNKVAGVMASALKMASTGKISDFGLRAALQKADEEGITKPHEIHMLMAEAAGGPLDKFPRWQAFKKTWGGFFSLSESFNRKTTFLAAYQVAGDMSKAELEKTGFTTAYDFAKNAVTETQGLYNKANRPNWARGAIGATLFTFKQFSIAYLEFLSRLPRKQQMLALGMLVLAAGLEGLPGADDLEDLIDTIGQKLGYATNSKKQIRKFMADMLGDGLAEFALHGFSALPGVPLDVSARLGMSNLIPGTALFNPSRKEKSGEVLEVFGAVGGLAKGIMSAADSGKMSEAVPSAIKNAYKGIEMWNTGEYRDAKGRKVSDADGLDAVVKAIGFNPAHVAADTRRVTGERRDVEIVKHVESSIAEEWARGILDKDAEAVSKARERLREWNEDNPEMPIKIGFSQIARRVKEAKLTRDQRFIKTAPPELRRRVMGELVQ